MGLFGKRDSSYWYEKGAKHIINSKDADRVDKALECFDKAIEIDPKNLLAWNMKSIQFFDKKKYENTIECCNKVIEIYQSYQGARFNQIFLTNAWGRKGFALGKLGLYQKAIDCYDEALKIKFDDEYLSGKKACLEKMGKSINIIKNSKTEKETESNNQSVDDRKDNQSLSDEPTSKSRRMFR